MSWFSNGVALAAAGGIIVIGLMYLANPMAASRSFGLPLPEEGAHVAWWLRLKGVRDIAAGLVVLAMMVWGGPRMVGLVLLIEALIPVGDMSLVVAAKGSISHALAMHGGTALLMIAAAIPLLMGAA